MCFWRCQLVGKVRNGRLVKLEGNPKSIDNGAAICARGNAGIKMLYDPDRLKYPKFGKAVFHGNNQEFQLSTKEEQLIADGCKRLIENAIICWNYMYLSKRMNDASSGAEKDTMTKTIKNGSVIIWQHFNLQGEYDFSEENLKNPIQFHLPELLDLQVL